MSKQKKILITGANGFLAGALTQSLAKSYPLVLALRSEHKLASIDNAETVIVGDVNATTDWSRALTDVDVVIHCAARAHIMKDEMADPLAEYRKVNVDGSMNLARQALEAGLRRFIYISSVKVNGESTNGRLPFTEKDIPAPEDAYGISKLEAEQALIELTKNSGMDLVIIRPPLVYGPGVKANFLSLIKLSSIPIALPFGLVHNKRSMVFVGNLVDFICACIEHPSAANEVFLVSDGEDISLKELITHIRKALGRRANMLPVPVFLLNLLGIITGKKAVIDRLVGDLQLDSTKAQSLLGWKPPFSVQQGIEQTVPDIKNRNK